MENKKIYLSHVAAMKIKYFTEHADGEISGMAKSTINEEGDVIVEDAIIFKQVCTAATTRLNDDELNKFLYELRVKKENPKHWNIWWHSHAKMQVFWSGTDDSTIEDQAGLGSHLISIVTNKAGEFKARVDVFPKDSSPFNLVTHETVEADVYILPNMDVDKEMRKTIEDVNETIKQATEILDGAKKQKEEIDEILYESESIKEDCLKEVKEKVRGAAVIAWGKNSGSQGSFNRYLGKGKKNRKSYYEDGKNLEKLQQDFEDDLDDVFREVEINTELINGNEIEYEKEKRLDNLDYCQDCYMGIGECVCGLEDGQAVFKAVNNHSKGIHKNIYKPK